MATLLYRAARMAAWGRAIASALGGNPKPMLRRVRNRMILRGLDQVFRF